jgi:protein-disulfide isomerase
MKDWPIFGETSAQAARMVLAARETGQYAQAMRALMANKLQLQWYGVEKPLTNAGIDPAVLKASLKKDAKRIEDVLARNYAQARALGFRGTPAFIIGNKIHPGMMREPELVKAIAAARAA